jgi:hypothetical protein
LKRENVVFRATAEQKAVLRILSDRAGVIIGALLDEKFAQSKLRASVDSRRVKA